ncbi:hypothetical protein [Streptomyces antnestii]|nr:hypothetical protein [Streptomyces sp. San01]
MTHTHIRTAPQPRTRFGSVSGERSSRDVASAEDRDWPTDTQVSNWAESAALSGYGPTASSFL